jgi:hypothetical protein
MAGPTAESGVYSTIDRQMQDIFLSRCLKRLATDDVIGIMTELEVGLVAGRASHVPTLEVPSPKQSKVSSEGKVSACTRVQAVQHDRKLF